MTEKKYTAEDIDNMIGKLKVLLLDETQGVINNTMKKNFYEEYKDFDTMTAWECFVDEINRIDSVIDLHDILAESEIIPKAIEVIQDNEELRKENNELKQILNDTVSQINMEIGKDHSLYSVRIVVDAKMYSKIKEICK